ncbi:hypothetical protein JCM9279_006145 [Rhodotorula babjevae]
MSLRTVLTIAGSDSGAGAGIQADLKTIAAHHCYGTSVITAITAQNTLGVQSVEGISPAMVAAQIDSVLDDIGADAIKTGMLFGEETIRAVVRSLEKRFGKAKDGGRDAAKLVLDPVCVSTSGHSLLPLDAVDSLRTDLLPWAAVVTPNIPEAEFLVGWPKGSIATVDDMRRCAAELASKGVRWVYLKGGHMPLAKGDDGNKVVVDLLYDGESGEASMDERQYLDVKNTHGTGCTLAAAVASGLAQGKTVREAVSDAGDYVAAAIAASYPVGRGAGPVNHFHSLMPRSLPLPNHHSPTPFTDYLIRFAGDAWTRYVNHEFPNSLAAGTAKLEAFLHFLQQDFHFLKQYARANALAAFKTEDMALMQGSTHIVNDVLKETEMHVKYCETYGISREQLQAIPESVTNIAYTRYVLDVSSKGDLLDARVVTAPCLIGYGHVGARLVSSSPGVVVDSNPDSNPYFGWITEYSGQWYQGCVKTGIDLLEQTLAESPVSAQRLDELARIFVKATELEIAFWDAAVVAGEKTRAQVLSHEGLPV